MGTVDFFDDREHIMDELFIQELKIEQMNRWREEWEREQQEAAAIIVTKPNLIENETDTISREIP